MRVRGPVDSVFAGGVGRGRVTESVTTSVHFAQDILVRKVFKIRVSERILR